MVKLEGINNPVLNIFVDVLLYSFFTVYKEDKNKYYIQRLSWTGVKQDKAVIYKNDNGRLYRGTTAKENIWFNRMKEIKGTNTLIPKAPETLTNGKPLN